MVTLMLAIQLLAEWCTKGPALLSALDWDVSPTLAVADLDQTGGIRLQPNLDNLGTSTLIVTQAVPVVPIVNGLHALGWKRGSTAASMPGWDVYAYIEQDGAQVRLHGYHYDRRQWDDTERSGIPLFADLPPVISRRRSFKAEYEEWLRKCHNDEW